MKGQQEAISVVLITGILIGVVGSVYFWGLPLIQKNKDITVLKDSEHFMNDLNEKIKAVANNGGRDQLRIDVPGILLYDKQVNEISLKVDTQGTIYDPGAWVPLGRNPDCTGKDGTWGTDEPNTLCVKSVGEKDKYFTTYTLKYIKLKHPTTTDVYQVQMEGEQASGGENHDIIIENTGSSGGITTVKISIR